MLITYAQNFEDLYIYRCFKGIKNGFYIDIGAQDAEIDSVTKLFYDMGWTGINVEPTSCYYEKLCEYRKNDINVNKVISNKIGVIDFYTVEETGLSTTKLELVKGKYRYSKSELKTVTIDKLIIDNKIEEIDFLKIDVEGSEQEVIEGFTFKVRPKLLLIESTKPLTSVVTSIHWEKLVLKYDYKLAFFDGLNKYYLAQEYYDHYINNFQTPPNVFDNFLLRNNHYLSKLTVEKSQEIISSLESELNLIRGEYLGIINSRAWRIAKLLKLPRIYINNLKQLFTSILLKINFKFDDFKFHEFKNDGLLNSCICSQKQLESKVFQNWAITFAQTKDLLHRKTWEWSFIAQALYERGFLKNGMKGLGFAVGTEPLASYFCNSGVLITATDLFTDKAKIGGWVDSNQHADGISKLNSLKLCSEELFKQNCKFFHLDMNEIPDDLTGFDFIWSSCSLEHLGSLKHGEDFIYNSMKCLKPGGYAIHTTEYNVSSNTKTVESRDLSVYRRIDIEKIVFKLKRNGHHVNISFALGSMAADKIIDVPPYKLNSHLKLKLDKYVITSIALIIQKAI